MITYKSLLLKSCKNGLLLFYVRGPPHIVSSALFAVMS